MADYKKMYLTALDAIERAMALLVTFVATDKSTPPEAKQKIEIPLPLNRSLVTFFRERKYPAGGKKEHEKPPGGFCHSTFSISLSP